jgi:hypothetical protein
VLALYDAAEEEDEERGIEEALAGDERARSD